MWILMFLLSMPLVAQDVTTETPTTIEDSQTLKIIVRAKGTGKAIKRAEVRIGEKTFFTDPQAQVAISIPRIGDGKIMISKVGFERAFLDFSEIRDAAELEVFLFPATPSDNEVVIRGEKRPEVSKKTLTVEESRRVAPSDDPAQVAALLPGVQTSAFGTDVAIRGSGPNDSLYFIDRFRVTSIFHSIDNLSVVPDQLISDVEFNAGGFGPQYGGASGGVIVLRTKTDVPEDSKTQFKLNIPFYSAIYHERPLSEDSFMATSFRYSYLQYIIPLFLPKDSGMTVVPYFGDAHVYYVKKDETGGYSKVFAMGSQDGLDLVFNYSESTSSDGKSSVEFYRGFATLGFQRFKNLGEGWSLDLSPQFLYDKADLGFFGDGIVWDYYNFSMYSELSKKVSKKGYFYLGLDPSLGVFEADIVAPVQNNEDPLYDYEDAPREELERTFRLFNLAAWSSYDVELGEWMLSPGMRLFYDRQIEKTGVDPRLSVRWNVSEAHALKASVGQYSVSPEYQESAEVFGNPDLGFERSIHYVTGWETKWSDRWETDFQLYYKDFAQLVVADSETNFSNDGLGKSYGAEVFIRRNLTERAFGWLSYTYSKTQLKDGQDKPWRSSDFDQSHVAVLTGSYKLLPTLDIGARAKYTTGNTYTPIRGAVYNASLDKYQPRTSEDDRNAGRLPNYHQIDIFVSFEALADTWKTVFRAGVNNLAFTNQVYAIQNNYDYSKEVEIKSIPPIPFIEVKGEF